MTFFDVIVIGAGHAGCEAAAAAVRCGARTVLLTFSKRDIGVMSCNPAIGGVGKGHIVREIDALDGLMARAADKAAIHYRMLNRSKGKAVHGPRVQADRMRYAAAVRTMLETPALTIIEGEVATLRLEGGVVRGVTLADGGSLDCSALVLATGTFLNGRMFRGNERQGGGRAGDPASERLANQLIEVTGRPGRLKTGTPPRLDGRTIAWSRLQRQQSDSEMWTMSAPGSVRPLPQLACGVTRTNERTHDIIRSGLKRSPLRSTDMEGSGPRYCPSIEDKVERFGDRNGHQVFLEPEGLDSHLIYPNGISTSLDVADQLAFVRSIDGLEKTEIVRPGYAVEYDFLDPRKLDSRLQMRDVPGLFLSGQINGTTGYEEAAGQGVAAGINAAASALGREQVRFDRASSYIGVMINDLTTHGVTEPYRMLTARAEFRLRLRADNAHTRLFDTGLLAGCLTAERLTYHHERRSRGLEVDAALAQHRSAREIDAAYAGHDVTRRSLAEWMRYPELADRVANCLPPHLTGQVANERLEDARYAPYTQRQQQEISRLRRDSELPIRANLDYRHVAGLSTEMVQKLEASRPQTLDQVSRIRGITPAAISAVLVASRQAA